MPPKLCPTDQGREDIDQNDPAKWLLFDRYPHITHGRDADWRRRALRAYGDLVATNGYGFYDSTRGASPSCAGSFNAAFCSDGYYFGAAGTGTVMWDVELFRQSDTYIGDGTIYVTIAHELGHAAQERFLFDGEAGAVPVSDIGQENQADCLAGATLSKAAQGGYLILEPGDLDEITDFLQPIADGITQGTPEERFGLFYLGYNSGDIESSFQSR